MKARSRNILMTFGGTRQTELDRFIKNKGNNDIFSYEYKEQFKSFEHIKCIPENAKLYICGHCDSGCSRLQSDENPFFGDKSNIFYVTYQEIAAKIKKQLASNANHISISLMACRGAVGIKGDITTSMAFKLTRELFVKHNISIELYGRTTALRIYKDVRRTTKVDMTHDYTQGQIFFTEFPDEPELKKQKGSKLLFKSVTNEKSGRKEIHILDAYTNLLLCIYDAKTCKLLRFFLKRNIQEQLIQELEKLSYFELTQLFNSKFDDPTFLDKVNAHKNPRFDSFFGINHTSSFRTTIESIRGIAQKKLEHQVIELSSKSLEADALKLLESAKKEPVFTMFFPSSELQLQKIQELINGVEKHFLKPK